MSTTAPTAAPTMAPGAAPFVQPTRGLSIASLVIGLASIVASWTFVAPIVGLVLGIIGLQREPAGRTFAIWGIVLNAVLLAGAVLIGLGAVFFSLIALPFAAL